MTRDVRTRSSSPRSSVPRVVARRRTIVFDARREGPRAANLHRNARSGGPESCCFQTTSQQPDQLVARREVARTRGARDGALRYLVLPEPLGAVGHTNRLASSRPGSEARGSFRPTGGRWPTSRTKPSAPRCGWRHSPVPAGGCGFDGGRPASLASRRQGDLLHRARRRLMAAELTGTGDSMRSSRSSRCLPASGWAGPPIRTTLRATGCRFLSRETARTDRKRAADAGAELDDGAWSR